MVKIHPGPTRGYLGWEDAPIVERKVEQEKVSRQKWEENFGCGTHWWKRYTQWVNSGLPRAMRKPSWRSVEWVAYDRQPETAYQGEVRTRRKDNVTAYFSEPLEHYQCTPTPAWPVTTYGEVGWLGKNPGCQLEIYGNKYMQKPPLPWYLPRISKYNANTFY